MSNHINKSNELPTLKDIEINLFRELQDVFQSALLSVLEALDDWMTGLWIIVILSDLKIGKNRKRH